MSTRKRNCLRKTRPIKLIHNLIFDKRAVSVALTTMIITAGVIAAGIAVLYWATSWGNVANDQFANNVANSQEAIGENIAFEYIAYSSASNSLTVYVINAGLSNNVTLVRLYLWNNTNQVQTYSITQMYFTGNATQASYLNKGAEAYFATTLSTSLNSGDYFTIRIVTGSGRNFDGSFST